MNTLGEILQPHHIEGVLQQLRSAKHHIPDTGLVELPSNRREMEIALSRSLIALYSIGLVVDADETEHNLRVALHRLPAVTACITLPDIGLGVRPSGKRFHVPLHRLVEAYLLSRTYRDDGAKRSLTAAIKYLKNKLGLVKHGENTSSESFTTAYLVSDREPLVARSLYWLHYIVRALHDAPLDNVPYPDTTNPFWFSAHLPVTHSNPIVVSPEYLFYLYLMEAQVVAHIALTSAYRRTTMGSLNHRINQLPARLLFSAIQHAEHSLLTPFELAVDHRREP